MIYDESFFSWFMPLGIISIILIVGCSYMYFSSKKWIHLYNKIKNPNKYSKLILTIHNLISNSRSEYHTYLAKNNNELHLYLDMELTQQEKIEIEELTSMKYVLTKGWGSGLLRVEFKKESPNEIQSRQDKSEVEHE